MGGALGAAIVWARADIRARWRSLVALGLIAGITAGLALACLVGAERTGSALERLQEETNASDAVLFSSQVGIDEPDWSALERRPEVDELGRWALVFGDIEGVDNPDELFFTPIGDEFMESIDRPIVVDGRMWDRDADDELLIAEGAAALLDLGVGDTVTFTPFVAADFDDDFARTDAPSQGPRLEMEVVGIVRMPLEPLFVGDGLVLASPGLVTRHPDVVPLENAVVRLHGDAQVAELQQHADADVAPGIPLLDLNAVGRRVTTTTDVQRTVLLLLAAVIATAGLVLAGQMLGRSASVIGADARTLSAIGMPRRTMATAVALAHLPATAAAAATYVVAALAAASVVPFGLAGRLDPDTGLRASALATAIGALVLVALLVGGAFGGAWRAAALEDPVPGDDPSGAVGWLRRHASVVVGLGATMAFRRAKGGRSVAVRPALLGAVVGVLGVAGAAMIDAGLNDALDHPERAGVVWDLTVRDEEQGVTDAIRAAVVDHPGLAEVQLVERAVVPVGDIGAPVFILHPVGDAPDDDPAPIDLAIVDGRAPRLPGEGAIGPQTAEVLDVSIGDTVAVGDGEVRIVGTALFPSDVHSGFDEGLWITPADEELALGDEGAEQLLAASVAPGVDPQRVLDDLNAEVGPLGAFALPPDLPPELVNLREIVPLPRWLGAFLAVLAVAALLHVLSSSARARARDFAVLRAIGVTRTGTRLVLHVQGVAVFLAGLVLGTPLGIAAGRLGWQLIADRVPLRNVSPVAVLVFALLVPVALLVSQVVAVGPGRRLRRLRPAEVLRTE